MYFAYGTLQKGFPNWPAFADALGDPIGRYRTVYAHALVVPIQPGCANPGCGLLHRMAALVPGVAGFHVEGELFAISRSTVAAIDRLESYDESDRAGLYVRTELKVVPQAGGAACNAIAYRVREPGRWRELVATGHAELLARYELGLADAGPKQCCLTNPLHAGPHDVLELFA